MTGVLKNTVALPVPDDVWLTLAHRQRRGRPDRARVVITQIHNLARRIADRIVRPGCQTVLTTVQRPRAATTGFSDLKSEIDGVADDVGPWRGRPLFRAEEGDVLAPALVKPTEPVEERKSGRRDIQFRVSLRGQSRHERRR